MTLLLDISRFISRAHLPFDTGIDRVERAAILDGFNRYQDPHFLARIGRGYVILNRSEMTDFLDMERTQLWPKVRGLDQFRLKLAHPQRQVRTGLRELGVKQFALDDLDKVIKQEKLAPFHYLNVGHTNLGEKLFQFLSGAGAYKLSVFIHDVIPIDFPQYCRSDRIVSFKKNFENVIQNCDSIFCNSRYTSDRIAHHAKEMGKNPIITVIDLVSPAIDPAAINSDHRHERPTFAMLGTIEPRKNLSFVLDIWDDFSLTKMPEQMPNLLLMGKRGWETPEVLARLDAAIADGFVSEMVDLDDQSVQQSLSSCHALLFPSHAEGYGLPAQEALALGVPVIASNIPVFRELFGGKSTLLDTDSTDNWIAAIEHAMRTPRPAISTSKKSSWTIFFDRLYNNPVAE